MARPRCDESMIESAVKCKRNGMSNKDIIAYLGIGESTFYKWCNAPKNDLQRKFGESLKRAETDFKTALRQRIIKAADGGSWQAAAWMLERGYPEEYARPEVQLAQKAAREASNETLSGIKDVLVKIVEASNEQRD